MELWEVSSSKIYGQMFNQTELPWPRNLLKVKIRDVCGLIQKLSWFRFHTDSLYLCKLNHNATHIKQLKIPIFVKRNRKQLIHVIAARIEANHLVPLITTFIFWIKACLMHMLYTSGFCIMCGSYYGDYLWYNRRCEIDTKDN